AGIEGQTERKSGANPALAAGINAPAMVVHDKIASHEVNSIFHRAIGTHDERIEDQAQRFFRQTGAVIGDLDLDFLVVGRAIEQAGAESDSAPVGKTRNLILEQQIEQPIELQLVDIESGRESGI